MTLRAGGACVSRRPVDAALPAARRPSPAGPLFTKPALSENSQPGSSQSWNQFPCAAEWRVVTRSPEAARSRSGRSYPTRCALFRVDAARITGHGRSVARTQRVFAYAEYLEVLAEGTEPLW